MDPYISLLKGDQEEIVRILRDIIRKREDDIVEFDNLKETQISGRSVNRIPTAANDVLASDRLGDISITDDSIYTLKEVSPGVIEWRKATLSTF